MINATRTVFTTSREIPVILNCPINEGEILVYDDYTGTFINGTGGYLSTTGGTMSGTLKVKGFNETYVSLGDNLSGTVNIDMSLGTLFSGTVTGDTTFVIINAPTEGNVGNFTLELTNGGSQTIYWPSCLWEGGTSPILTSDGLDIITGYTRDGGSTIRCFIAAKDIK